MVDEYIPAVEMIYRELARPKMPALKPACPLEEFKRRELTKNDVQDILQYRRTASAEELQDIISKADEYGLTANERNRLSLALTGVLAQARQHPGGRRDDPGEVSLRRYSA